jgi:hypothetical protein
MLENTKGTVRNGKSIDTCNIWYTRRRPKQKKLEAQPTEPVSLTFQSALWKRNTEPSIDASYQISIHLATQFQRKILFFGNQPIRNKSCQWQQCFLPFVNEMFNLYKRPSIHASYQVSVH